MAQTGKQDSQKSYLADVKTVFLLGAGTSTHMKLDSGGEFSVPMDKDFFACVEKMGESDGWQPQGKLLKIATQARDHVKAVLAEYGVRAEDLIPKGDSKFPRVSMEEAFCHLEMLRMLGVDTRQKNPSRRWRAPVDAFRDLIAIVMAHSQPLDGKPSESNGYEGFIHKLLKRPPANQYAIITLNYELGLECAINNWYRRKGDILFRNTCEKYKDSCRQRHIYHYALPNRELPKVEWREAIPLLKLHGSCNWGICPDCGNVEWLWAEDGEEQFKVSRLVGELVGEEEDPHRRPCSWHAVDAILAPRRVPHIVPPTWNKWMGDLTLRHIWREAYGVLRQCERLFLIGTRLAPTDAHLRHLISLALSENQNDYEVYVVNPSWSKKLLAEISKITHRPEDKLKCRHGKFQTKGTLDWIFQQVP